MIYVFMIMLFIWNIFLTYLVLKDKINDYTIYYLTFWKSGLWFKRKSKYTSHSWRILKWFWYKDN